MARHERDFRDSAEAPLTLDELVMLVAQHMPEEAEPRADAVARYLARADGWHEAVKQLGGAFAEEEAGLSKDKED